MQTTTRRNMEKCDYCRVKRVKCTPTNRDWCRGEKCHQCEAVGQPCGPNKRAPSTRSRAVRNVRPTDRPSPPPPSRPLALAPPRALEDPTSHPIPTSGSRQTYGRAADAGQTLFSTLPHQAAPDRDAPGYSTPNDRITLSFIKLGDLRMTLNNVANRLRNAPHKIPHSPSSSHANAEVALVDIAYGIKVCYGFEIEKILELTEGLELSRAESVLRRALESIDHFHTILQTPALLKIADCNGILKSKFTILDRLVKIYHGREDFAEAERLLLELSILSRKLKNDHQAIASRLAESHITTSERMRNVLAGLEIRNDHVHLLQRQEKEPFPPLHRALLDGNESLARLLWENTPNPHEQVDILGRRPVHVIAETSNLGLLDLVHFEEQNVLQAIDISRMTPLSIAAYMGNLPFFETLFHSGTAIQSRDEEGRSIMCVACSAGHLSIVQFLLDNKIPPDDFSITDYGSPIHAAASAGHLEVCRALLIAGAKANPFAMTSPIQAARNNGHDDVARLIEEFPGYLEDPYLCNFNIE